MLWWTNFFRLLPNPNSPLPGSLSFSRFLTFSFLFFFYDFGFVYLFFKSQLRLRTVKLRGAIFRVLMWAQMVFCLVFVCACVCLYQNSSSEAQLSRGKKRANPSDALVVSDPKSTLRNLSDSSGETQASPCRPWDRGDYFRRLATFKSMLWFAKPQVRF